jgi:hypothetical protein
MAGVLLSHFPLPFLCYPPMSHTSRGKQTNSPGFRFYKTQTRMIKFDDLLYQEHRISRFPPEAKLNEAVGG